MENFITKNGKAFIVRQPTENNAANIIDYLKVLIASTDQIVSTLYDHIIIKADEGRRFIANLDHNPNSLLLIAEISHRVIGYLEFTPNLKIKLSHTGEFVVNVHPDFQGLGIGSALVDTLLNWAKQNSKIEKVYLRVLETNLSAINFFNGAGFKEECRHLKAVKQLSGEYVDLLQLYIWTK